jgi:hypothetical protein
MGSQGLPLRSDPLPGDVQLLGNTAKVDPTPAAMGVGDLLGR